MLSNLLSLGNILKGKITSKKDVVEFFVFVLYTLFYK